MKLLPTPARWLIGIGAVLLGACASQPSPADWQGSAFAALRSFSAAYLSGNTRVADLEFARAKTEISSTGRTDLLARAELLRCAVRVASLEFDECAGYQPLAQDATAAEQSYAAFLGGHWSALDASQLPAHYRTLVALGKQRPSSAVLASMPDPLARLIGAGVLLQRAQLSDGDIELATQTASDQGWRRPLLAWLGVQLKQAHEAHAAQAAARIQRRIDMVLQTGSSQPADPPQTLR